MGPDPQSHVTLSDSGRMVAESRPSAGDRRAAYSTYARQGINENLSYYGDSNARLSGPDAGYYASAMESESLWLFWLRTIPGQFISSVRINNNRGRTGLKNPSYQGFGLQIFALAGLGMLPNGLALVVGWLISSLV